MRRLILTGTLLFFMLFCIICYSKGMTFPIRIYSFAEIQNEKDEADNKMNTLATKKSSEFQVVRTRLGRSQANFETSKTLYEAAMANKSEEDQERAIASKSYDLSYLWVKLGNYASETKCDLTMEVYQDPDSNKKDENYVLCDFKFNVVSSYNGTINFMDKLATDSDLGFIPENLKMHTEYRTIRLVSSEEETGYKFENGLMLVTDFYKKDIPITKATLSKVENQQTREEEQNTAEEK